MRNKFFTTGVFCVIFFLLLLINFFNWGVVVGKIISLQMLSSEYIKIINVEKYINIYLKFILTIFLLSISAFFVVMKMAPSNFFSVKFSKIKGEYFLLLIIVLYVITFSIMSFMRYLTFHSYHDMTANLEAIYNILITGWPLSTAEGLLHELPVMNWFGIHFTPIVYIFAILFFPFRFPDSVFILQSLLLSLGALPLYFLAKDILGNKFSAFCFATVYLLYPTLQYTNLYEFEFFRFATPLLLWGFYLAYKKRLFLSYIFLFLAMLTREEVAPLVFILGIYFIFKIDRKIFGVLTAATAFLYAILTFMVFRPAFYGGGEDFVIKVIFGSLGNTPFEMLLVFLKNPLFAFSIIFSPIKIVNVILLLLPLGFLSLASPVLFFISVVGMIIPLISLGFVQSSIIMHKYAVAIPFIFISAIYGLKNIGSLLSKKYNGDFKKNTYALSVYILVAGVLSCFYYGPSPISLQFWDKTYKLMDFRTKNFYYSSYKLMKHDQIVYEIIDMIPKNAIVSSEHFLLPHLYDRKKLYTFPVVGKDVEYILVDRKHPNKHPQFNPFVQSNSLAIQFSKFPEAFYSALVVNKTYELMAHKDGVLLFRKSINAKQEF